MIKIISTELVYDIDKTQLCRYCEVVITDNSNNYQLGIGGLPLVGELQPILNARHDELLQVAFSKGTTVTNEDVIRLMCEASWSNCTFQIAVIETIGRHGALQEIYDEYQEILKEWTEED